MGLMDIVDIERRQLETLPGVINCERLRTCFSVSVFTCWHLNASVCVYTLNVSVCAYECIDIYIAVHVVLALNEEKKSLDQNKESQAQRWPNRTEAALSF